MPTFAERARQAQQAKRSGQDEKDPADLSGAQEPDWDDPGTWGSGGDASESASGNPGDWADGNDGSPQDSPPSVPASAPAGRPPRRRGRPRGPQRVALSVRLLASTDRRLTAAVQQTGLNPQSIVEQALQAHFRRLRIEDPGAEPADQEHFT
ncbi:hypothetical protein ACFXAZ_34365 [Streptomyces sp. NPDC059477]|uniref:hypothetical protein n=1 Tax=Streptomyces sp. NPDC059477 TaxID=3346847 RepID=UPI003686BEF8